MRFRGYSTKSVRSGESRDPLTGSVTTPIYQTSNFAFENTKKLMDVMSDEKEGYVYTRYGNPTTKAAESKIADLEDTEDAAAFSSGMAAISTAIMTLVSAGDHIVSIRDVYGGTFTLFNRILPRFNVETTFVDAQDLSEIEPAIKQNTKVIYIESPTNPTLRIVDMDKIAKLGMENGITTVVDNTFASPLNQQPAEYGIEVVIHSSTKYLGGHNDLTAGFVCGKKEFILKVKESLKVLGGVLDPHCAYLLLRGMKTLALRVTKQNLNGLAVATYLESHPKVRRVHYPGLESHAQYELARRQMKGFGGVVSFELKGDLNTTIGFVDSLRLAYLTPSLGGTETLVTQPATTSHFRVPIDERLKQGITDSLVRLSMGIEDAEDIIEDLEQALDKI